MIANGTFFRVGESYINPRNICSAQRLNDGTLIVYLNNGRIAIQGDDATRLEVWLDEQTTDIPSSRSGGKPHG